MPVLNKDGQCIGVTQVLNKKGGPFTAMDERRLRAFSAQTSIAIENAKLFEDVLNMKNYSESMLESMSNGVISLDAERRIVKFNTAARHLLGKDPAGLVGSPVSEHFSGENQWVLDSIEKVVESGQADISMDTDLVLGNSKVVSVNMTVVPPDQCSKGFYRLPAGPGRHHRRKNASREQWPAI